jgi:hypothetical protein
MRIEAKSKRVMSGDSIAAAGRSPAGEATPWNPEQGWGKGYVSFVNALLTAA